jgi:hypothetical protein
VILRRVGRQTVADLKVGNSSLNSTGLLISDRLHYGQRCFAAASQGFFLQCGAIRGMIRRAP